MLKNSTCKKSPQNRKHSSPSTPGLKTALEQYLDRENHEPRSGRPQSAPRRALQLLLTCVTMRALQFGVERPFHHFQRVGSKWIETQGLREIHRIPSDDADAAPLENLGWLIEIASLLSVSVCTLGDAAIRHEQGLGGDTERDCQSLHRPLARRGAVSGCASDLLLSGGPLNSNARARSLLAVLAAMVSFLSQRVPMTDKIGPLSAVGRQLAMANTCHAMIALARATVQRAGGVRKGNLAPHRSLQP